MKLFKLVTIFFGVVLVLTITTILYDLASYDPSYINRKAITFSFNNLNSSKVYQLYKRTEKLYYYSYHYIFF